jgi:hypothetical protein
MQYICGMENPKPKTGGMPLKYGEPSRVYATRVPAAHYDIIKADADSYIAKLVAKLRKKKQTP